MQARLLFLRAALAGLVLAGGSVRAQSIDETYNQKIREYTTDARFCPNRC